MIITISYIEKIVLYSIIASRKIVINRIDECGVHVQVNPTQESRVHRLHLFCKRKRKRET